MKSWEDVKPRRGFLRARPRTLLLGNGFNISLLGAEGLSYSRLKDNVNPSEFRIGESVKDALGVNANSFEVLIRVLEQNHYVSGLYGADVENMSFDARKLRTELARGVSELHPVQNKITDNNESGYCANLIKEFDNLFTLNYDILLYWVILKENLESVFKDGFGKPNFPDGPLVWMGRESQNVFYSHGALHLEERHYSNVEDSLKFEDSVYVRKIESSWMNIIDQVVENIKEGRMPLTVVEGTSEQKIERIMSNPYLKNCLIQFTKLKGVVYTYGWAAAEPEDSHLITALGESSVTKCFFGVLPGEDTVRIREAFAKINSRRTSYKKKKIELEFYDVTTVPMWRDVQCE